jgi:hypothetical protein
MSNPDETSMEYAKRIVAAHTLAARLEEFKAAIFDLKTHAHNWDNQKRLGTAMWEAYHRADKLRDELLMATNVAHYG